MKYAAQAFTAGLIALVVVLVMNVVSCTTREETTRVELGERLRKLSDTQDAFASVASLGRDFVVSLTVLGDQRPSFMDYFRQPTTKVKGGSGLVIHPDGWVLTNRHVIKGAKQITIRFADGRTVAAVDKIAGLNTDLAFVKIPSGNLIPAPLGDSDKIRVGDWAIAIGSPFGFDQTLTVGVISARGRKLRGGHRGQYETFIQTDAAINSGNSGGPLLNIKGEVIGVNTAIYSHTNSNLGIGFAIPINRAKELLAELLAKYGKSDTFGKPAVEPGYLGVNLSELNPAIKAQLGVKHGVFVDFMAPESPAERAGLQKYDIITAFGGHPVDSLAKMKDLVSKKRPGATVTVTFLRDNRAHETQVTLGKR